MAYSKPIILKSDGQKAEISETNGIPLLPVSTGEPSGSPASGFWAIYMDSGIVYAKDSSGNITQLTNPSVDYSIFHLVSAATTNATSVKASAGDLHGYHIYNNSSQARKVAFHNTAGTPTAGASVLFSLVIPPDGVAIMEAGKGQIPFSTGIGITTTRGMADNDTEAVELNDLVINLLYT